jgi:glycosyltransferase involved in cell wall biosynthesis
VYEVRSRARLAFAGPSLDPEYTALFQEELEKARSFARWIPAIPCGAMHSAYESADIVVNASSSEGLSNAILEGIASGRAILASDIPGNRWPVNGGEEVSSCGFLFSLKDCSDFVEKTIKLIDDDGLRNRFGRAGKELSALWPGPDEEATRLIRAYERAIESQHGKLFAHS